jgi:hypothetical protein
VARSKEEWRRIGNVDKLKLKFFSNFSIDNFKKFSGIDAELINASKWYFSWWA